MLILIVFREMEVLILMSLISRHLAEIEGI